MNYFTFYKVIILILKEEIFISEESYQYDTLIQSRWVRPTTMTSIYLHENEFRMRRVAVYVDISAMWL